MQWLGGGLVLLILKEPLSFFCHMMLPVVWSKSKFVLWYLIFQIKHFKFYMQQI